MIMPALCDCFSNSIKTLSGVCAALILGACATPGNAAPQEEMTFELPDSQAPTYVDLVEWGLQADIVAIVLVEDQIAFPEERAPDVPPSQIRLYIESLTQNLLAAPGAIPETMVFVVDQPRDFEGDAPDLEERRVLVFGDQSRTQTGAVQLLASHTMLPAGPRIEARVRRVLAQLAAADAPSAGTGVRDVISVPGNLAGESETQMFVETEDGAPVSLTVIRRPGMRPQWGVSMGEIVDAAARPPQPETLDWYRFACFLPKELPADSFLQGDRASQQRARADYALVLRELGPCDRRFG